MDSVKRRLTQNGAMVPLSPKAIETLRLLIEARNRVVERDELIDSTWVAMEDPDLTVVISNLRKALGRDRNNTKFIQTFPRLGY